MKLSKAIDLFAGDYKRLTARTYRMGLKRFMEWMKGTGMPVTSPDDFDTKWVIPFARSLKREGLSPRTVSTYLTGTVQFLKWLRREGVSDIGAEQLFDLGEQVKAWNRKNHANPLPRLPQKRAVVDTLSQVHEIDADTERERLYQLRNIALFELLASTGCRISEAANLKRKDLLPEKMAAYVRGGKGGKDRMIVFRTKEAWDSVQGYLAERDKLKFSVVGEEPVFSRHDKSAHARAEIAPLTTASMRVAMSIVIKEANAEHFTPHQLRHLAATDLLRKTGNPAIVQQFLGHADISTTVGTYTHLSNDDVIDAVRG